MRTETGPETKVTQHKGTEVTIPDSDSDVKMEKEVGKCFKCPTNILDICSFIFFFENLSIKLKSV